MELEERITDLSLNNEWMYRTVPGSAFNLLYGLTEKVYNQGEIYGSVKDKNN